MLETALIQHKCYLTVNSCELCQRSELSRYRGNSSKCLSQYRGCFLTATFQMAFQIPRAISEGNRSKRHSQYRGCLLRATVQMAFPIPRALPEGNSSIHHSNYHGRLLRATVQSATEYTEGASWGQQFKESPKIPRAHAEDNSSKYHPQYQGKTVLTINKTHKRTVLSFHINEHKWNKCVIYILSHIDQKCSFRIGLEIFTCKVRKEHANRNLWAYGTLTAYHTVLSQKLNIWKYFENCFCLFLMTSVI